MTVHDDRAKPPCIAAWLIVLFASAEDESLLGDLLEEFSELASTSGAAVARRWYWRQALQSTPHLFVNGFRSAPWSTTAVVVAGYLLIKVLFPLPEKALFAVLHRYRVFDRHFNVYVFFATDGAAMVHVLMSMLLGCFVGLTASKREMIAATTLVLVLLGMTGAASVAWVTRGNSSMLWSMLPWNLADWLAMLAGAAIIRSHRLAASTATLGR